ncbi:MAG: 1-acyl-sn-glycerol-3-phosphate acyltransferase [Bacteroidales bacterium]
MISSRCEVKFDVESIDKPSFWYAVLYTYVKFFFKHIYFVDYKIVSEENIPTKNISTVIVANHQNGLIDALAVLFMFKDFRQPLFIARADIFRHLIVAKALKFLKIMPAFRSSDGQDVRKNEMLFDASANILMRNRTITLFPEGVAQTRRLLQNFRRGFARLALRAEEKANFNLGLKILPVGLHYSEYSGFRKKCLVCVGKSIELSEYKENYILNPQKTQLDLTRRMQNEVSRLMLNVHSDYYDELMLLSSLYESRFAERLNFNSRDFYDKFCLQKKLLTSLEDIEKNSLNLFNILIQKVQVLRELQDKNKTYNLFHLKSYSILNGLFETISIFALTPLFLVAYLLNILPYMLCEKVVKILKNKTLSSTISFSLGTLCLFPLFYGFIIVLTGLFTSSYLLAITSFILLPPSFFFFLWYKNFSIKYFAKILIFFNKKHLKNIFNISKEIIEILDVNILINK